MRRALLGHALNLCCRVGQQVIAFRSVRISHGLSPWVDGEGFAQFGNAAADALLDLRIAFIAVPAHALDHFGDQAADLAELGRPEPAGVPSRTPEVTNGERVSNGMPFLLQVR